jgi:hypothetical protein
MIRIDGIFLFLLIVNQCLMSSKSTGMSGQVNSMKSMDVRRLWEKLHNSEFRDNCFAYYREATFDKEDLARRSVTPGSKKMGFLRRLSVNSTEKKVVLAVAGVLGLGIGITRIIAYSSQTNSVQRVDSYVEDLRGDWQRYQESIRKS